MQPLRDVGLQATHWGGEGGRERGAIMRGAGLQGSRVSRAPSVHGKVLERWAGQSQQCSLDALLRSRTSTGWRARSEGQRLMSETHVSKAACDTGRWREASLRSTARPPGELASLPHPRLPLPAPTSGGPSLPGASLSLPSRVDVHTGSREAAREEPMVSLTS